MYVVVCALYICVRGLVCELYVFECVCMCLLCVVNEFVGYIRACLCECLLKCTFVGLNLCSLYILFVVYLLVRFCT